MVRLPILTELRVTDYELFPGSPAGSGINWSFQQGVTVIAGINGLGKTTLLLMILRSLTGRFDLTADGALQSLSVVLPERPVRLSVRHIGAFQRRVSDGAANASIVVSASIGEHAITIKRRLNNLSLEGLTIDEQPVELPAGVDAREVVYQSKLTELIGLGSFVDVLLVLHHVILFLESRPGALWDTNAQRHLLRALCLDQEDARRVAELERQLQSADSRARNVHARMTTTERRLNEALEQEAEAEGVLAEMSAEQELLDAELGEVERLEGALQEFDDQRKRARLAYERAKIAREEADGAVERLKYTALLRHYPSMDDTTRLVLSRIMRDGRCMACGSPAEERQAELERQVATGCCAICGAEPDVQGNVTAPHEVDQARLERERERAAEARREEAAQLKELEDFAVGHTETLSEWERVQESIVARRGKNRRLRARLPDTVTSREYQNELERLRREHDGWQAQRASRLHELRTLFAERRGTITARSEEVVEAFAQLVEVFLAEEVRLVQVEVEPRYLEAPGRIGERVAVPAYAAEMTAAARPAMTRRSEPGEVSESQRELIDLAFRLALVGVFGGASTFVIETPEASLDGISMERVGRALSEFASGEGNRLVVTTNLTNGGIVTAMFEATERNSGLASRLRRVLNLLEVAAPNRALIQDRERYQALLEETVAGTGR